MRDLAPSLNGWPPFLYRAHGGPLASGAKALSDPYFPVWFPLMPDLVVCWKSTGVKVPALPSKAMELWQVTSPLWALASPLHIVGLMTVTILSWSFSDNLERGQE